MKIQALAVVVVVVAVLSGQVAGDTKVVAPYSYVHHTAAAVPAFRSTAFHYAVPKVVPYSVPHAVQYVAAPAVHAVRYSVPQTVQYHAVNAVPAVAAVRDAPQVYTTSFSQPAAAVVEKVDDVSAVAAVRSAPTVYSASYTYSQPAATVVRKVEFDDDDDDVVVRPLTYGAAAITHDVSLEEVDDDDFKWASPYSRFDVDVDDRYDFDDDRK